MKRRRGVEGRRQGKEAAQGLRKAYRFIRVTEIIDAAGLLEETAIFTATYLKDLNYRHKQLYLAGLRLRRILAGSLMIEKR